MLFWILTSFVSYLFILLIYLVPVSDGDRFCIVYMDVYFHTKKLIILSVWKTKLITK